MVVVGVLISLLFTYQNSFINRAAYILAASFITLVVAFRAPSMGPDWVNYLDFFAKPNTHGYYQQQDLEPFIHVINYTIRIFTNNKIYYGIIVSSLYIIPVMIFIYKYSYNRALSLFLFISYSIGNSLFILSFAMLRQFLAIAIFCVLVHYYLKNNRKINNLVIVLFVVMVFTHSSSLMVLILYVLDKKSLSKQIYYIAVFISLTIGYFIGNFLPQIRLMGEVYLSKGFYFETLTDNYQYSIIPLIPYAGLFVLIVYLLPHKECNNLFMKAFFISVVITGVMSFGNNVDRMTAIFNVLSIIAIPNFFKYVRNNKIISYGLLSIIVLYFSYKYFKVLSFYSDPTVAWNIVPYKSIFD